MKVIHDMDLNTEHRYIEVWNKVDMIKEEQEEEFNEKVQKAIEEAEYPIVLMSCKTGFNKDLFLDQVGQLAVQELGKTLVKLQYPSWEHNERVSWLIKWAQISPPSEFETSDDGQAITLEVMVDEVVYQQYLKKFEPEQFYGARKRDLRWWGFICSSCVCATV